MKKARTAPITPPGTNETNATNESKENATVEAGIGRMMAERLAEASGATYEDALEMLAGGEAMPTGHEALSGIRAAELAAMAERGEIDDIDALIADPGFVALLAQLPADKAMRVFGAEKGVADAKTEAEAAREKGRLDAMDEIKRRRSLPVSARAAAPAQTALDFANMSEDQFRAVKRRMQQNYANGVRTPM